jgi:hypothetical protein
VMSRIKALYRSWAIPCSGTTVYAARHRSEWLAKIPQPGVRLRAERFYQQLDLLRLLHQQARCDFLVESHKHPAVKLLTPDSLHRSDAGCFAGSAVANATPFPYQATVVGLQRIRS